MTTQTLDVGGMTCGHCLMAVKNSLSQVPGLTIDEVRIGKVRVTFDPATVPTDAAAEAVRDAGYDVLDTREG